jgi:hypothetical protein
MNRDTIEISELNFGDIEERKSVNFGGGLELLMNEKLASASPRPSGDIDLDDLNNLEMELNNLADDSGSQSYQKQSVHFEEGPGSTSAFSLGQATMETGGSGNDNKSWDGYAKFNNIPVNPDKVFSSQPAMSKEEVLREKFKYLKKLEALEKKGVELSKKYNMESPLAEMQGEYETIMEEKTKQNSVKFQGNMMMAIINGIEFLNNRFDPFDIKLDGWSDQINENLNDYDDIFGELHDKYKSKASMAPELKLLFQLGGSAMMVHMTNTMFKSAMPGVDDILRQNPELMRQFQTAAVNTMGQTNPGFGGFMNGLMNNQQMAPGQFESPLGRGPPAPINSQADKPGNFPMRPDLNMGMGGSGPAERSSRRPPPQQQQRPEMKGPSDISDILSGLKTKSINIQETQNNSINDSSTISISDLKELQSSSTDGNFPKRTNRRKNSEKNTISLDI